MPAPIGGAFALHRARRHSVAPTCDPEREEFRKQKRFIQANLECTLRFLKNVIPPRKGKLEGEMVLEAFKNIEFSGIFIIMKGLPVDYKKLGEKHLSNVKFTVEESTRSGRDDGGEYMRIDENSREMYPLEFEIPEELPPPMITAEGKLIFRMQAFISTLEGRHVMVGEVPVRWMGSKVLKREEIDKQLVIEQQVHCRRTLMAMGRRKSCGMEWRVEKGGYLPGEGILVEVLGESRDKGWLEVECFVEFVQKVWYQVPSKSGRGIMWVNMKVNVLASAGSEEAFEVDGDQKVVWATRLQVPKRITPTMTFELINSVSYAIRASVRMSGESKEGWVKGEVPILIGSSKEVMEEDVKNEEVEYGGVECDGDEEDILLPLSISQSSSFHHLHQESFRGSGELTNDRIKKSQSMAIIQGTQPRVGSVSSMEGLASRTLSVLRLPPNGSQLLLRRLTLHTLSPQHCRRRRQSQQLETQ